MMTSFDLYRTTSKGPEWVGTFLDFNSAKLGLTELAEMNPGHYAIYDQSTGARVFTQMFYQEQDQEQKLDA
jgi:hypothetical protein